MTCMVVVDIFSQYFLLLTLLDWIYSKQEPYLSVNICLFLFLYQRLNCNRLLFPSFSMFALNLFRCCTVVSIFAIFGFMSSSVNPMLHAQISAIAGIPHYKHEFLLERGYAFANCLLARIESWLQWWLDAHAHVCLLLTEMCIRKLKMGHINS